MKLYDYFRSSAAYRVRIALALKGLEVERVFVHLARGEQRLPAFLAKNPQGLAPALELDDGTVLTQSLAIIEYLDTLTPSPRLVPADPLRAAKVRGVALAIACDIHPLNNRRVLDYLRGRLGQSEEAVDLWVRHWALTGGLEAIERLVEPGPYCFGAEPTLADVCLIPQMFAARRFATPLAALPKLLAIEAHCAAHPAFAAAHPARQPDAE
ncbi:maleylacetoacetate isomerase [Methylosinus trichosporium]|uniref:Maleylacetoacetate isomerase n=1 Tax=Methylosinus trichosporium (strain ATCC 35070 / NCIMB 11131 / UNIQEM 75 / OB3b) TaxID=595536 RepID=A0A2D2CXH1_METT3|nr:maleylacetoacetate isomerase [Methylosinus trichosporium]ATQ67435.1 maleylacetoacetate isomerase [Methylosinus trichosporium OB3b]